MEEEASISLLANHSEEWLGRWFAPVVADKEAVTAWLTHYKYNDRRLVPQLHCPLCSQLNHERRIQGLQDCKAAAEWAKAWPEH